MWLISFQGLSFRPYTVSPPWHCLLKHIWKPSFEVTSNALLVGFDGFWGVKRLPSMVCYNLRSSQKSWGDDLGELLQLIKSCNMLWTFSFARNCKMACWHNQILMLLKIIANMNKAIDGLKSISLVVTYSWGHFPVIKPFHWGPHFTLWSLITGPFTENFRSNNWRVINLGQPGPSSAVSFFF